MKRLLFVNLTILAFLVFNSCNKPIEEYKFKNENEKEIIELLTRYTEAINKGDSDQVIPLFHENGVYVTGSTKESLPREKLAEWNSERWLTYGQRKIYNPEITINGDEAKVMAKVIFGNTSYPRLYTLVKENNEWLIMKRE